MVPQQPTDSRRELTSVTVRLVGPFELDVEPQECGQFATEVRIYPWHELLSHDHELGLMKWL